MITARSILLAVVGGCLLTAARAGASDDHPVFPSPPGPEGLGPCQVAPSCPADHVYVFLMNGLDPAHFCAFPRMVAYVRGLGYCHVYYGELTAGPRFVCEIRRIHEDDPCARIVLVGYSLGANAMSLVASALKDDGIQVDLLFYMGAVLVYNGPLARPDNALRVVNVRDSGLVCLTGGLIRGLDVDGADNIQLPGLAFHQQTPSSPILREILACELAALTDDSPPPCP